MTPWFVKPMGRGRGVIKCNHLLKQMFCRNTRIVVALPREHMFGERPGKAVGNLAMATVQ